MSKLTWLVAVGLLGLAPCAYPKEEALTVLEDFSGGKLAEPWSVSNANWAVAGGELRGSGNGQLDYLWPLTGDLALTFEAWTSEKSNVEVKLIDPATGGDRFTFAFLGVYHSVLKGVKCCMLKGNGFVAVAPRMWIYPGRRFTFDVRMTGGQYQMRLDGALGPVFVDKQPAAGPYLLRIIVSPESETQLAIDDIRIRAGRASGAARPASKPAPVAPKQGEEPTYDTAETKNVVVRNHADPSFRTAAIAAEGQKMFDYLATYVGAKPARVVLHVGRYPNGFARPSKPDPELFMMSRKIFDTTNDYAHEMMHCFTFRYGRLPHWFNESLSDLAYIDSEIDLYARREEKPFLESLDRIDHRSFELIRLRARYGRGYFPKVCRVLEKRRKECLETFKPGVPLLRKNELILSILSEAAGEDLTELFRKEFGFDPKTRERQRGY